MQAIFRLAVVPAGGVTVIGDQAGAQAGVRLVANAVADPSVETEVGLGAGFVGVTEVGAIRSARSTHLKNIRAAGGLGIAWVVCCNAASNVVSAD